MSDDYPLFVLDWDYETFAVKDRFGDVIQLYDVYESFVRGYCASEHPEYIWLMGWLWCGKEIPRTLYRRAKGKSDIYKRVVQNHA